MRFGGSGKRPRNNRGHMRRGGGRNQSFESTGPDVKVRGAAQQVADKYLALARDASSSGDVVAAENYLQHAEHYQRIVNLHAERVAEQQREREGRDDRPAREDRYRRLDRGDGQPGEIQAESRQAPRLPPDSDDPDAARAEPERPSRARRPRRRSSGPGDGRDPEAADAGATENAEEDRPATA